MTKAIKISLVIFVIVCSNLFAQKFTLTADKTTVGEYESFQVYFEFSGGDINKAENFVAPTFENFRVLGGPNQSTSMQIINGKVSGSLSYSYVLRPQKTGTFTIGPGFINYEGKKYTTGTIKIKVVKGKAPAQRKAQNNRGGLSDEDIAKNVFIRAVPSKTHVVQGEQITVLYKLYTKLNISSPSVSKLPVYKGFWAEDLDMPRNISYEIEMYNGQRFRVATIKKVALFPTKSGLLEVTPFELNVPVLIRKRRSSRSLFDDFFNDPFFGATETYQFLARSNSLKIKVDPLPVKNVPDSFKGAVGEFSMKAYLDKQKVKINDAISLKIQISGRGNIKLVDMPQLNLPPGFEQYDPKESENIMSSGVIAGTKNIEYLLVPRLPGKKVIPEVKFSFYSLKDKKYKTLTAGPFEVEIEGDVTSASIPSAAGFSKEDVRLLNQDIRFIKTDIPLIRIQNLKRFPSWFWWAILVPSFVLVLLVGWRRKNDELKGNIRLVKSQKARKEAIKRLKIAKKALDKNDSELFYNEIAKALQGYLEDKLFIPTSEFSIDKATEKLEELSIAKELIQKVKDIFNKCEFIRFAPSKDHSMDSQFYKFVADTITDLENNIKKVVK